MAREMKDSGVAWIGEIPSDWKLSKIGSLYSQRIEKVSDKDYPPLSVTMKGILPQLATAAKSDDGDNRKLVRIGDFAINSRSDRRGSCGVSLYDGSVSLINIILTPRNTMNSGYYDWLFHTSLFADEFYKWGHGIVDDLWTTRWQEMKSIIVPVPNLHEQERIAHFLNQRCAEIDTVLDKTRTSIEEYKKLKQAIITQAVTKGIRGERSMKNSGVAWIGIIPSEWDVSALGKFITIDSGISVGKKYELGTPLVEVPYLRVANVQGDHVDLSDVATIMVTPEEAEKYKLKNGQLLMTEGGDRDKLGRGCLWNGEIENCIHQNHIFSVQTNDRLTVRYLDYLTTSEVARAYFDLTAKKTTNLACTNKSTIQKFVIPIPKVAEQEAICDYLDGECKKLDRVLQAKANIIEQLNNYKKSLIYEYVTGKREVPETKNQSFISFIDARALLMCRIIELLKPKGRIHLMKALYTVDCMLNLNSTTQYQRQKHGPYDARIEEYEKVLMKNGWVDIKAGSPVEYTQTETFEAYREKYQSYYGHIDDDIQRLCSFLQPMKTSKAERVATLLAAWNDFILQGIKPTDSQLVQEVRSNWTPNKAHSSESTWLGTLAEMKVHKIIPLGYGKCTVHMK